MAKTNLEYIRELSIEDLAKFLIKIHREEEIDYDWDEKPIVRGMEEYFETSDGILFDPYDYDGAVEHEIEWLKKHVDHKWWQEQKYKQDQPEC